MATFSVYTQISGNCRNNNSNLEAGLLETVYEEWNGFYIVLFHVFEINSRTVPQDLLNLLGFPGLRQNLTEILEDLMKVLIPIPFCWNVLYSSRSFSKHMKQQKAETMGLALDGFSLTSSNFQMVSSDVSIEI